MFLSGLRAGYLRAGEQRARLGLEEAAAVDQLEVVDVDAFLLDGGRARRHRAGREAADVLVMAAARDVEQHFVLRQSSNTGVTTVMSGRCVPPL